MGRRNRSEENSMGQMGHNLSPKTKGWTGNKRHQPVQQSITGKWWWNLMQQNLEIWAKILDSKYGGRTYSR